MLKRLIKISLLVIVILTILIFSNITYFTNNILSDLGEKRDFKALLVWSNKGGNMEVRIYSSEEFE